MRRIMIFALVIILPMVFSVGIRAESPKEFVINSVESMLEKPFQAKLSPKMKFDTNLSLWYRPGDEGKYQEKVEVIPIGNDKSLGFTVYADGGIYRTVRCNNIGNQIVLNLKSDDLTVQTLLTGGVLVALNGVFPKIRELAELPGVLFSEAPDEEYNKIPCRVITMSVAQTYEDFMRQCGIDPEAMVQGIKSTVPSAGSYFKWYIGKKDGFVYSYQFSPEGIDRKAQQNSMLGEWYVEQVTFPWNIPDETFEIPEGLESFDVEEREDIDAVLRYKKTMTTSQQFSHGIKKRFNSWQGTSIWNIGDFLMLHSCGIVIQIQTMAKILMQ